MMNQTESLIFKMFMWTIGIMATAMVAISGLTYKSQIDTAAKIDNFIIEQSNINQYATRRFNADSLEIIDLKNQNSRYKTILIKLDPESFADEFYDKESFFKQPISEAVLPKNKYSLKDLSN